jgi:GH24 family phage-related lysozyme (muramidase)
LRASINHEEGQVAVMTSSQIQNPAASSEAEADTDAWSASRREQPSNSSTLGVSESALDMLKVFEGLRLDAYDDSGGVATIGYGHTGDVQSGQRISQAQADRLLRQDIHTAEAAVRENVDVPLTQGQYDALVSFTFNTGTGALESSTLLNKVNSGDNGGAEAEFGRWVHDDRGAALEGLVDRRAAEAAMFGGGDGAAADVAPPRTALVSQGGATDTPSAGGGYTVSDGEWLSSIAVRLGIPLDALIAANPQIADPNLIYAGQRIQIPAST